ncbi:MAG: PEP-CTERM sorting domain-containing protein [Microcystis novacekii Mn_MB_F_20050700_S1]|uniref:PEP-CTERM sorting domain-containing protein n=1 Tax=Microcystis novacekii Mn_MB_F_20050700_S1D TaxID=2486266 RepID=A0A552IK07_9CHRO|nr:MAG: PEP-CTERM sorting domain-containing protein [Microcystis novacekii Mn_MB_F_20050700_S1]TRU83815.1 MAG: PEP-CTERM sorting domain-containing protein [Microcystis novacekii Mn_MB_F_20050700_S1D]
MLVINATIKPQPNTVTVKVSFTDKLPPNNLLFASTPIVIEQGYILDQCTPIPEPSSTLGFLALGTLGAASTLKRKLKSSKSSEKETAKVS